MLIHLDRDPLQEVLKLILKLLHQEVLLVALVKLHLFVLVLLKLLCTNLIQQCVHKR